MLCFRLYSQRLILHMQCNRLDFGKEVLGMSVTCRVGDTAQLVCHSHHDLKIWQLSQVRDVII